MKLALISLLAGSAAAFAPAPTARTSVACNAGLDDLKSIAEKSNPVLKVSLYHHLSSFLNMLVPLFVQVHSPNILLFVVSSVLRSSRAFIHNHLGKLQRCHHCIPPSL